MTGSVKPSSSTLLEPTLLYQEGEDPNDLLECSVHTLPKPLLREFRHVFGDQYLEQSPSSSMQDDDDDAMDMVDSNESEGRLELLAIPTNQKALKDLVAIGDDIEKEKDRLLNVFLNFGRDLCQKLRAKGYWADFIDPCSGLPMLTLNCNKVYSEVDGMECLLNYRAYSAGFCKILVHPKWGSAVYPATIFAHAPVDVANELVKSYPTPQT
mmetsp:Transcript_7785/g.11342  ORF Transcript_7785/g.11342 Transcript_7785/m.11342 type:complete len:211 (-) Transcript_7785:391-1023(-)